MTDVNRCEHRAYGRYVGYRRVGFPDTIETRKISTLMVGIARAMKTQKTIINVGD
jgi:hypothetical protein